MDGRDVFSVKINSDNDLLHHQEPDTTFDLPHRFCGGVKVPGDVPRLVRWRELSRRQWFPSNFLSHLSSSEMKVTEPLLFASMYDFV